MRDQAVGLLAEDVHASSRRPDRQHPPLTWKLQESQYIITVEIRQCYKGNGKSFTYKIMVPTT